MLEFVNFYLVPGLVLGCVYALGAIGISLTFGILRFSNFAHGDTMTFGIYVTLSFVWLTGAHPLLVMPLAMAITSAMMLGLDRAFFKPFRKAPPIMTVIASFGLMLMIRSMVQFFWGPQVQAMQKGIQMPVGWLDPLRLPPKHIYIILGTILLMMAVHLLLTRTKIGKAMRATSDNPDLAALTGINTERVVQATWVLGASLAVAAGVFLSLDAPVETNLGFKMLLPMFAAAILGGIGKPYGAVVGGLVIGVAEELSTYPWIGDEPLISPGYKAGVAFAIMVLMLIWRPQGLLRGRQF